MMPSKAQVGMRVKVTNDAFKEMIGRCGVIRRLTVSYPPKAWVEMDLPHSHSPWPKGDERDRQRKYYMDELEPE